MHGRLKVKTTAEQAEAKRKAREEKLKIYNHITKAIFTKREKGDFDEEALKLTGQFLEQNPDFYTYWNYRKEILLQMKNEKSKEELQNLASDEMILTQNCLKTNPKSYGAWHHRYWAMEFMPEPDWKKELKLCGYFLSLDERNFHCWDYRRFICKKCEVIPSEELSFTTELIEKNFSNYSAWHYRTTLLPLVHPGPSIGSVNEDTLLKEYDLVQNAAFTDPNDQSVWFYHRWLLGRSKIPLEVLCICILKQCNKIAILLSEPTKLGDECDVKLCIDETSHNVTWTPIDMYSCVATVWICDIPVDTSVGKEKCEVSVELLKDSEKSFLSCCVNGSESHSWKKTSRADSFRSELSASTKDVLQQELESCQQLYELEPGNKWTLFTSVLLMRALNDKQYDSKIFEYLKLLMEVDISRGRYYQDLASKFAIENVIETLPVEAQEISLSGKQLSCIYHFDQLILIKKLDLSSNSLTSLHPLCNLICVQSITLDDNQLTSFDGLEGLMNLKTISAKRNNITETKELQILKGCSQLKELFLDGNPIVNNPEYIPTMTALNVNHAQDL